MNSLENKPQSQDTPATTQCTATERTGPPNDVVADLRDLLGQDVVLLHVPRGQKGPRTKGWQNLTMEDMANPRYLAELGGENIGVLQGAPSNGLDSVDIDDNDNVEPFLELNPNMRNTLQTRGARGRQIWVRIIGDSPNLTKLNFIRPASDKSKPTTWGEWRATGGQTIIHGQHPSGKQYEILKRAKPIEVRFDSIVWPSYLDLPWELGLYDELVEENGEPYALGKTGSVQLNQPFHVAKFATEHLIIHEPQEKQFYRYNDERGLWPRETTDAIKQSFAKDLKSYADSQGLSQIERLRTNSLLTGMTEMLRGRVEKPDVFERRSKIIHVGNGMLHLDTDPPELRQFSPSYYSRNQCPVAIVPNADCPKFKELLLAPALNAEDISLLQRFCASILLGGNPAQRILLLTGKGGGGKSTFTEILEMMIGKENVTELRTEFLNERFELFRYIGKTFLTGKDVPAGFLMCKGASTLKKLVGHDLLTPEGKGLNSSINMRGDFGVAITCNNRLRVRLEGDAGAWRRRLIVVEFNRNKPAQRIAEFAQVLFREEASGILNWMLEGAIAHLAELKEHADFVLTKAQQARADVILAESDSVREFVQQCLRPASNPAATVTVDELVQTYTVFCAKMDWHPSAPATVERQLPDLVLEIHDIKKRHDIETPFGIRRGFKGLEIAPDYES